MITRERVDRAHVVGPELRSEPAAAWVPPLTVVLRVLPVVALIELVLMRSFYRVGIYLPKDGPFRSVYAALTTVGSFALNLSTVLAGVALALVVVVAVRRGYGRAAAAVGAFLVAAFVLAAGGSDGLGPAARLTFVLAIVAVAWPSVRAAGRLPYRAAVLGVTTVALLSSYAGLAADAGTLVPASAAPTGVVGAQLAAELLVVATAFAFAAAWIASGRARVGTLLLGAVPALALLTLWRANGAITGILVLWTAGLRLYLPVWLYVAALWAFAAAALGWRRRFPLRTGGMVLLLVAGMLLGSTYVGSLLLVALILLTEGAAFGGLPSPELRRRVHG